ncbi:MAG: 5-oxoprolinase subunit PxpB [Pseudoxanthomonas mexicana]|nr:5-oxoprolinase subunit PxpB [Pseudoxanthomonas mexicana]
MSTPHFEPLGDDALLVRFGGRIEADTNAQVHQLAARLRDRSPCWLRDLVPAYASLAVFFDADRLPNGDAHAAVGDTVAALLSDPSSRPSADSVLHEVPVCYGGEYGEDLVEAAQALGLDAGTLIARHSGPLYTVAMIGFAPGFPYLLGLDSALALPRLATPRTRVPAGSVAIGGAQAGIYPRASPGGWRLLGRTPRVLFDVARAQPALLQPGDRVRFVPIDEATFRDMAGSP